MNQAFTTKAKEVMGGKMTILATSPSLAPPKNEGVSVGFTDRLLSNMVMGTVTGLLYGGIIASRNPDYARDMRGNLIEKLSTFTLLTRVMTPVVAFTAVAATYTIAEGNSESIRAKKDPWNAAFGGAAAGVIIGILTKRMDKVAPCALGCALVMAGVDAFGIGMMYLQEFTDEHAERKEKDAGKTDSGRHTESDELAALKEKYPNFKDL